MASQCQKGVMADPRNMDQTLNIQTTNNANIKPRNKLNTPDFWQYKPNQISFGHEARVYDIFQLNQLNIYFPMSYANYNTGKQNKSIVNDKKMNWF
jgi:hypothetical protein